MKIDYLGDGRDKTAVYRWMPEEGIEIRGYVEICHGISEHMGRYSELGEYLSDYGYAVIGHDFPGHGKTSPDSPGMVKGDAMEKLQDSILRVNRMINEERKDLPLCIFGHSMGSFLALRFMETYPDAADILILSGSSGRLNPVMEKAGLFLAGKSDKNKKKRGISKMLFFFYNMGYREGSKFSWLSRDRKEVRKYENDPLCGFSVSDSFMGSLVRGLSVWLRPEEIKKIRKDLPILLISGSDDAVGERGKGVVRLAQGLKKAGISDVYLRIYEGARHEILFEEKREDTMNDIATFIENMSHGKTNRNMKGNNGKRE